MPDVVGLEVEYRQPGCKLGIVRKVVNVFRLSTLSFAASSMNACG
jgi:hypothetical protein